MNYLTGLRKINVFLPGDHGKPAILSLRVFQKICLFVCALFFLTPVCKSETLIDANGREIVFHGPFKRIISLYGAHTENLFYLGAGNKIIGVSRNSSFPEQAKTKPWFSYHDDPEKFLGAGPDIVLIRPMLDRGYPALMNRLEKSGITVVSLQPSTLDGMYEYWFSLGKLTGRNEEAGKMVGSFKKQIDYYDAVTMKIKQPKLVYFEAIHSRMKTFTPGSMAIFALETAGGINIADDAKASRGTNIGNYGKERILSHAMNMDVYLAQTGVMNHTSMEIIKNEPGFGILKAVKNNQIYLIDEMIVSRPCYRLLQGIEMIGNILYPELFSQITEKGNCIQ